MFTGAALDRLFAENLHAVDQRADAVGLVADQHGEFAIGVADAGLQQLRRAADAGQRVLHLMRQDRRHAGDAARGAAERQLAVERRAAEASCSTSSTAPGSSGSGEPCTVMPRLCSRGLSSVRS
jgi:hypothetical protein